MSGGSYWMMNGREGKSWRWGRWCFGDNDDRWNFERMKQGKRQNNNVAEVAPAVVEPTPVAEESTPTEEVIPTEEVAQ